MIANFTTTLYSSSIVAIEPRGSSTQIYSLTHNNVGNKNCQQMKMFSLAFTYWIARRWTLD